MTYTIFIAIILACILTTILIKWAGELSGWLVPFVAVIVIYGITFYLVLLDLWLYTTPYDFQVNEQARSKWEICHKSEKCTQMVQNFKE